MESPFLQLVTAKRLLIFNIIFALLYLIALIFFFQRGSIYLYAGLLLGEAFHLWQLLTLIHAAWDGNINASFSATFEAPVDIYITVAGEPLSIVEKTVKAALNINYRNLHVYILNDGKVANKDNWQEIANIPSKFRDNRLSCITRDIAGGAKAGNINHALSMTKAPYVAVFDCDHIPESNFLKNMMGYFIDPSIAFVQSPQYYANHANGYVANAAWQQQTLFFGTICRGKA